MKKVFVFTMVGLIMLFSCETPETITPKTTRVVMYTVESSPAGFDITYENSSGGTSQEDITGSTWDYSFTANNDDFLYISAQAGNENTTITVKIFLDGVMAKESTSSGDYVISTASL